MPMSKPLSSCVRAALLSAAATVAVTGAQSAEYLPFPPPQDNICSGGIVDKDKLADYLLRKYPVATTALSPHPDTALAGLSFPRQILAGGAPSLTGGSSVDQGNYASARGFMSGVLAGLESPAYVPKSSGVDMATYFRGTDTDNAIACGVDANGRAIEAPGALFRPADPSQSHIRIRGKAADLYIDRNQTQYFAASSQASFDVARNNVAKSTTYKLAGYVGYAITPYSPKDWQGDRVDAVFYAGANLNIVTASPGSAVPPGASRTVDFGALFDAFLVSGRDAAAWGHLLTLTPDYLFNLADDSRLLTWNLSYTPVLNKALNAFVPVGDDFWVKPILVLKDDNGFYTDRGNVAVAASHKDYLRLGGQIGMSVLSENQYLPFALTTSYTRLHPVTGVSEVGYFSNSLTYSPDPNKYWGITVSYTNGTREDTAQRESQWDVALGVRF